MRITLIQAVMLLGQPQQVGYEAEVSDELGGSLVEQGFAEKVEGTPASEDSTANLRRLQREAATNARSTPTESPADDAAKAEGFDSATAKATSEQVESLARPLEQSKHERGSQRSHKHERTSTPKAIEPKADAIDEEKADADKAKHGRRTHA